LNTNALLFVATLKHCPKHIPAIAATIRSFQPRDLAPISVVTEVNVGRFYPLQYSEHREGIRV
jgi:hypothetical protein